VNLTSESKELENILEHVKERIILKMDGKEICNIKLNKGNGNINIKFRWWNLKTLKLKRNMFYGVMKFINILKW
jgi:hypothetical protein